MSLSSNVTGREFQRHGPATEKLLSPRRVCLHMPIYRASITSGSKMAISTFQINR